MLRLLRVWLAVVCAGCATGAAASRPAANGGGQDERLVELSRIQGEQSRRIAELEARLTLLEADARRARGPGGKPSATVRIGEQPSPSEPVEPLSLHEPLASSERSGSPGRRPNLRLSGRTRGSRNGSAELPPLPVTDETLPVVPLPQERSRARLAEPAAPVSQSATEAYRAALRALRERRFEAAALELSSWVADNPNHALLDRAMYWLAEARYATRDYRAALQEFERVLERFPNSEKTPETLYKLAMCWRRLGAEDQARTFFRRLRAEYPNSEAAGLASREGST